MTTQSNTVRKSRRPSSATARDRGVVLDPDVTELMRLSADIQRATTRELRSLWRTKKISERGLYILELVNGGLDRPSRLIEYFGVLPSTITFETDKLVAAGLIRRESVPDDRRVVRLSLTDAGLAVHKAATQAINEVLRPRLAELSREELDGFLATFHKILDPLYPLRILPEKAEGPADSKS